MPVKLPNMAQFSRSNPVDRLPRAWLGTGYTSCSIQAKLHLAKLWSYQCPQHLPGDKIQTRNLSKARLLQSSFENDYRYSCPVNTSTVFEKMVLYEHH